MNTAQPKFWKSRAYPRRWRVIEQAPGGLTEYIRAFNEESGRPTNARPATASGDFLCDVRSALSELPQSVLTLLGDKFLGVYLAHDLAALPSPMSSARGDVIGVAIASMWTRSRIATRTNGRHGRERAVLGGCAGGVEGQDCRTDEDMEDGAPVLLLHEIGHVLVAGREFLPAWWSDRETLGPPAATASSTCPGESTRTCR